MMKSVLAATAALLALTVLTPAAAQSGLDDYRTGEGAYPDRAAAYADEDYADRIDQLRHRLQGGIQRGTIDREQAYRLRQQLRQVSDLEQRYSRDGLSGSERAELQQRLRSLREQIRYADSELQGRYGREYNPRDNGYDRGDDEGENWGDAERNQQDDRFDREDDDANSPENGEEPWIADQDQGDFRPRR